MSRAAVKLEKLSKRYRIGTNRQLGYRTLREAVSETLSTPLRVLQNGGGGSGRTSEFWALNDVSFNVNDGEVVGIIGRNGAGKSTLLKILSGITPPTSGRAVLAGRVGSLLEVGTGFHQELSGRENVYLNGSILGMRRKEIDSKFDAIVDYSGVEQFLDTPVKRYSSGMRVRLAFAVAAFLEPEILIVDEVLAVGDAEFQRKCLGTMSQVASSGRTVLFVSHNMPAVRSLCDRCVVLDSGRVAFDGRATDGIDVYSKLLCPSTENLAAFPNSTANATIHNLKVESTEADETVVTSTSGMTIQIDLSISANISRSHILMVIWSKDTGERIGSLATEEHGIDAIKGGQRSNIKINMPFNILPPGEYRLQLNLGYGGQRYAEWESIHSFTVIPRCLAGAGHPYTRKHGVCIIPAQISVNTISDQNANELSAA